MSPSRRCAPMTTKKKTARRKTAPAKTKRRPAPKVKALAALSRDPVLREDVTKRNHRDGLLQIAFAWSPFGLFAAQAAFWGRFGRAPERGPLAVAAPPRSALPLGVDLCWGITARSSIRRRMSVSSAHAVRASMSASDPKQTSPRSKCDQPWLMASPAVCVTRCPHI